MHRFFILEDWIERNKVTLEGEQAHQILDVLRLKPQDHITVLDDTGWEYEVEIEKFSGEAVQGRVTGKEYGTGEPGVKITLYQALLKADKLELVLQKGVELGVSAFVPFISERCVVNRPGENKVRRWEKIVREAAEQSGRALLPQLHSTIPFEEACQRAETPSILLWEEERQVKLRQALAGAPFQNAVALNIFIGPEGGFPASEAEYARAHGIVTASLGQRLLRAETAGIAAVSAILYQKGELG